MSSFYNIRPGDVMDNHAELQLTVQQVKTGGMGIVIMASNKDGKWVAMKTIKPEVLERDPDLRHRFIREAVTWVGMWPHPNILRPGFLEEFRGQIFLLLEYAPGGSLRDILQRAPRLPLDLALEIAQHVAAGLVYLHTPSPHFLRPNPIVHRDLKPENILIATRGAVVTDFGLVTLLPQADTSAQWDESERLIDATHSTRYHTRAGTVLGTPAYMAPEQWQDITLAGPLADMYAFGLVLCQLLTSQDALLNVHQPHTLIEWRRAHAQMAPLNLHASMPKLPMPVIALYKALLAKNPSDRPTASETLTILQQAAQRLGMTPYAPRELEDHTPDNESLFWINWANTCSNFGLLDEAWERAQIAHRMAQDNPESLQAVRTVEAQILSRMKRTEEAVEIWRDILADCPGELFLLREMAITMSEGGKYAEADQLFAEILQQHPTKGYCWADRAKNQGRLYVNKTEAGQEQEARVHLAQMFLYAEQALHLEPNNALARQILQALS